jgi:hypothetical protein
MGRVTHGTSGRGYTHATCNRIEGSKVSATARLNLPYIAPLQAQKQVTYNEAMAALDQLVQPAVKSRTTSAPPGSPTEGDAYVVAPAATGAWSGKDGKFACWLNGGWSFRTPANGWLAYVIDTSELAICQSGAWASFVTNGGTALAKLGINATADLTNRLSVAADATLLSHDGGGHRLTLNKASAGDTASLLLQHGFSGRAEIGLSGDDALHVKVSPDGSTWHEALSVDQSSGRVTLPVGQLAFPATQNPAADANTLDDYEEGVWTPALNFGGAAVGMTYATTPAGRYTKIGRTVFATGSLALSAKGSSTGSATIAGLPFVSANDGIPQSAPVGLASGMSAVSGAVLATLPPNVSRLSLYQSSNGAGSGLTQSNFGNSAALTFSVVYDV